MAHRYFLTAVIASLVIMASALPGRAADALVIPVSGTVSPALPASGELHIGDKLNLGTEAIVAIIHFRSCEEIELQGGTLIIRSAKVQHQKSKILFRAKGDCPGAVDLVETDTKGAVTLMRGPDEAKEAEVNSGTRPRFLLSADRSDFFAIGVFDDGSEVARMPLKSGRAEWPADAPTLKAGHGYDFVLEGTGSKTIGGRLSVTGNGPKLILLRP